MEPDIARLAEPTITPMEEYHALAKSGNAPDDAVLRKGFIAAEIKVLDEEARTLDVVISTAARDRDHDTIAVDGWDLSNFMKNPVVMWAHDYRRLPVGRALKTEAKGKALRSTPQFHPAEIHQFADTVFRLYAGRWMNAFSVGFRPLEHVFNEEANGIDFVKQELMEYSAVPVPSNPEALQDAKAAGIDLEPLRKWASAVLDEWADDPSGPGGLWLPRSAVEATWSVCSGGKTFMVLPAGTPDKLGAGIRMIAGEKQTINVTAPGPGAEHSGLAVLLGDIVVTEKESAAIAGRAGVTILCAVDGAEGEPELRELEKGAHLAQLLSVLVDAKTTEERTRSDVVKALAEGASVSQDIVNADLRGATKCPPAERLTAYAEFLGISADVLMTATAADGCPVPDVAPSEPADGAAAANHAADSHLGGHGKDHAQDEPNDMKRAISYRTAHPDGTPIAPRDQEWNGGAERAAASVDDLKVMSSAVVGDSDLKGSYKLPHHQASGKHSLVFRGLVAAAGRLGQARLEDGDLTGVQAHLGRHYREFDEVAPWDRSQAGWSAYVAAGRAITAKGWSEAEQLARLAKTLIALGFEAEAEELEPGCSGMAGTAGPPDDDDWVADAVKEFCDTIAQGEATDDEEAVEDLLSVLSGEDAGELVSAAIGPAMDDALMRAGVAKTGRLPR